ncbi:MAG: hypothetical protein BM556_13325 [Bacteriovorax sp. MedPE-SWde]|nr:MAG: hypothetical protein BM556_13325 [Bacteriovorax sp. MedPE-SWde]
MVIETGFLGKMCKTNVDNINSMDFVLNLDILNGCVHFCDGCFIQKERKGDWSEVLKNACKIAEDLTGKGLRFRELILGPTDFFSARNTIEILKDPYFQKLLSFNEKTRITASCVFSNMDRENFLEIFNILDNESFYRKDMILEFLVPLNSNKMLDRDQVYLDENKWALNHFENNSPKVIDWSYVVNIGNNEVLREKYAETVEFIKTEFNTILEFNPGFFRTNNNKLIDGKLSYWKGFLQDVLSKSDHRDLCLTSVDKHHNTANTICLNILDDKVFFSPFIYEQIIDKSDLFLVDDLSADSILAMHTGLQTKGYQYAGQTSNCEQCSYLTPCVGRNVLNFMEVRGKTDCIFPEEFKEIF